MAGFREVFPFLAEELEEVVVLAAEEGEGGGDGDFDDHGDGDSNGIVAKVGTTCPFGHRNAGGSPKCGTQELDDRTISLIRKLNRRDKAVYLAAVMHGWEKGGGTKLHSCLLLPKNRAS